MEQQQYVEKLEKSIDNYLNNITKLQKTLGEEEKELQKCLRELRFHESNYEIATYKEYAAISV